VDATARLDTGVLPTARLVGRGRPASLGTANGGEAGAGVRPAPIRGS
jgi:hypothetical protein